MNQDRERELLERDADRVRDRLQGTLEALDQRRHQLAELTDVKKQVREHATPIGLVAGGLLLGTFGLLGYSIYHAVTRKKRLRQERMNALMRFWNHPERLARSKPPKGSLAQQVGRGIVTSALTVAVTELSKRSLRRVLDGQATTSNEAHVAAALR
jgi:hypothetical protein